MSGQQRKLLEPAYLLHHRPWSDSSRILDLMTRGHGRVTLFAHGARRPKSPMRSVLRPFVPLLISWSGRADGGTLTAAEAAAAAPVLAPGRLLSGYYLNELLLKLLPKEDRHETLFDAYASALGGLATGDEQAALRQFERVLLDELGYGVELSREAGTGRPLDADRYYHFEPGRGVLAVRDADAAAGGASGPRSARRRARRSRNSGGAPGGARHLRRRDRALPRRPRAREPGRDAGHAPAGT